MKTRTLGVAPEPQMPETRGKRQLCRQGHGKTHAPGVADAAIMRQFLPDRPPPSQSLGDDASTPRPTGTQKMAKFWPARHPDPRQPMGRPKNDAAIYRQ